jgi:hypothetical protein
MGGVIASPLPIVRQVNGLTKESSKRRSIADRRETISPSGSYRVMFAMSWYLLHANVCHDARVNDVSWYA